VNIDQLAVTISAIATRIGPHDRLRLLENHRDLVSGDLSIAFTINHWRQEQRRKKPA
jgi:hypothetical protein